MVTYVETLINVQVGVHVSLVRGPNSPRHTRPGLLETQDTLDVIAVQLLSGNRINNNRIDSEEWQGGTTRLSRRHSRQGGNDVRSGLGLPISLRTVSHVGTK